MNSAEATTPINLDNISTINFYDRDTPDDEILKKALDAIHEETGLRLKEEDVLSQKYGGESAILMTDEWVFKFPRDQKEVDRIYSNAQVLQDMEGKIDNVPWLLHVGRDTAMTVETRLPGKPLVELCDLGHDDDTGEMILHEKYIGEEHWEKIATDVGRFMGKLSMLCPPDEAEGRYSFSDTRRSVNPTNAQEDEARYLTNNIIDQLKKRGYDEAELKEKWDALEGMIKPMRRLSHDDLGGLNVLYDAENEKTYFIDFGFMNLTTEARNVAKVSRKLDIICPPDKLKQAYCEEVGIDEDMPDYDDRCAFTESQVAQVQQELAKIDIKPKNELPLPAPNQAPKAAPHTQNDPSFPLPTPAEALLTTHEPPKLTVTPMPAQQSAGKAPAKMLEAMANRARSIFGYSK